MKNDVNIKVFCPQMHREITVYHKWFVHEGEVIVIRYECNHNHLCKQCAECLDEAYAEAVVRANELANDPLMK